MKLAKEDHGSGVIHVVGPIRYQNLSQAELLSEALRHSAHLAGIWVALWLQMWNPVKWE